MAITAEQMMNRRPCRWFTDEASHTLVLENTDELRIREEARETLLAQSASLLIVAISTPGMRASLCVSFLRLSAERGVALAAEVCLSHSQPLRVNQEEMAAGEQQRLAEGVGHGSFFSPGRGRPTGDFDG